MRDLWTARRKLTLAAAFVAFAASALATETDDQIVEYVHQAVVRHHLYAKPDCMKYQIIRNAHPRVDEVDVFERHDAVVVAARPVFHDAVGEEQNDVAGG